MVKKKEKDIDSLADIAAATGGQTLAEAGRVPYWVDTGNLALNFCISGKFIGGGFPGGRVIESFGPEASGKSLLGYCFLGAIQRMGGIAIMLDCERASSADFASRCGHVDPDRLLIYYPITLQQVEKKIYTLIKAIRAKYKDKPIGIMWDSIGVNPTDREWGETELPENPTASQIKEAGGQERPGERAKAANKILRNMNPFLNGNNATIYVVNQLRQKIGVLYGNPWTTTGGGEALKYYSSVRLAAGAPKEFVDKKTKFPLGVNMSVKNKKNRHFTPGLKVEQIPLFFGGGINPLGGLMRILVQCGRIEGKGTYTVLEPWAKGEKITFKASLDNPVDAEVLYRCPGLIDAADADAIKDYLQEWNEAIQLIGSAEEIDTGADISYLLGDKSSELEEDE
jgi:recombination protein RecA